MRHALWILLLAGAACAAAPQSKDDWPLGSWRGIASFRGANLAFELHCLREADSLRATFTSPDLMILEQPLRSVRQDGKRLEFVTRDDHPIRFEGVFDGSRLAGEASLPEVPGIVERHPGEKPQLHFELRRSQAAPAPPYTRREVAFDGAGVRLAGTLFEPAPGAPRPGVVLLQGSSSTLRQDYWFHADHFARAGFAVLTFDKRGNGASSGDYGAASYDDLAADAAHAVDFLRRSSNVDSTRVGIWGLSQGAFIAPWVASRARQLAFIVAISPPGGPCGESIVFQDSMRVLAGGWTDAEARQATALHRRLLAWLQFGRGEAELAADLERFAPLAWRRATGLPARLPTGAARDGWYWRGRTLDPLPAWRALRVPVLVVFGAADDLVPAAVSAQRIRQALKDGGHSDATVRIFPAANHVLRHLPLVAGGAWDWPRAAPGFVDSVTTWMIAHARGTRGR